MGLKWLHAAAARATRNVGIAWGVLSIVALCASVTVAGAPTGPAAPEISPSYATSALTLLAGGMLLLRSKVRR